MKSDILTVDEAKKKKKDFFENYDAIVYGGWSMAGTVVKSKWFLDNAKSWRNKRLAIFCVGASPAENPDVADELEHIMTAEQHSYIGAFYCQGGIDYDRMKMPSRLAMKAFASTLSKKKDATEKEKAMAEMIAHSYDISDEKYIEPIVEYLSE